MLRPVTMMALALGVLAGLSPDAWAQADVPAPDCPPGAECEATARWGAWGLIALGLLFIALWLVPTRLREEEEEQTGSTRIPMLRALHRRIERELTGWRRLQWPLLGLFFLALGIATLAGWR